jgi:glucosamine 6-phosphate synthetase-like amidotransferase/phosphosugar isomerase protein
MCGLVGIAGGLEYKDEEAMQRMMLMNWFRGKHSTGLAAVRPSGEVRIVKAATDPMALFEFPKFKDALNGHQSCVFLGHARAATKGAINNYNAHPFRFEHIVGAHNGTLMGSSQDDLEKEIGEKYPVDSMSIIASIAAIGIAETVKLLRGSWAISWVDLNEGTMNFLRNKERPLYFGTTKDKKLVFWASEWPAIVAGLHDGYREMARDKDGDRFFEFPADYHYKFDISSLMKGEFTKAAMKKREGKEPFLALSNHSSHYGGHSRVSDPFRRTTNLTTTSLSSSREAIAEKTRQLMTIVEGTEEQPYAGVIHRDEFETWAFEGCQFCQTPVRWGDTGITIYVRDGIVLCREHSCVQNKSQTRIFVPNVTESVPTTTNEVEEH